MSKQIRNMACEQKKDSVPLSDIIPVSFSLILKVKNFSNETIHKPGEPADIAESTFEFEVLEIFSLDLYANGMTSDDKGYVTVQFRISIPSIVLACKIFEFSYVFRVIDASENKRFPQSYVIDPHSYWSSVNEDSFPIIIDRLLKRDFLLSDKDDLLPGDCLSLQIDIDMRAIDYIPENRPPIGGEIHYAFTSFYSVAPNEIYLDLDSEIGKRLTEVSAYFQRMSETPMVERKTRSMKVPHGEFPSLRDVGQIIMGTKSLIPDSISDICQMYITADKYDIPIAIESCRNLLITLLRVKNDPGTAEHVKENIPTLQELAETYNDMRIKENIESFLKNNREDGGYGKCTQETLQSNLETEWMFERVGCNNSTSYFRFKRNI